MIVRKENLIKSNPILKDHAIQVSTDTFEKYYFSRPNNNHSRGLSDSGAFESAGGTYIGAMDKSQLAKSIILKAGTDASASQLTAAIEDYLLTVDSTIEIESTTVAGKLTELDELGLVNLVKISESE